MGSGSSMADVRLELLDQVTSGDAQELVKQLDSTEIVVRGDVASLNPPLILAVANLVARLFPSVTVETTSEDVHVPPFGSGDLCRLANQTVRQARVAQPSQGGTRYVINAGGGSDNADLYVAADAWTLRIGRQPLSANGTSRGPAVAAAAALAAAQTFLDLLPGVAGHRLGHETLIWNLLDYHLTEAPDHPEFEPVHDAVCFGGGSVGSSLLQVLLLSGASGSLDIVDPDRLSRRNKVRYPLWLGHHGGWKVDWLERIASGSPLQIRGHRESAAEWVRKSTHVPQLAIAAVDTIAGRRQVTDALARTSLNAGIDGLRLHISRHGFGDGHGCLYCPYVDAGDLLDETGMYVELTGLSPERITQLLGGDLVSREDLSLMVRLGRLGAEGSDDLAGSRLQDVARARLYAQATLRNSSGGVLAVSAPFVSAMAGALLASEMLKGTSTSSPYRLDRRVDFDCSGLPTGFTSDSPQDPTGRCLCHDSFRLNAYRTTWPAGGHV